MDINSQYQNLLGNQIRPNRRIFVFWRAFWIQNGRHSKPTMDINSQHHNLLGNQIAQIGRFLYLAAILYLGYHGNGRHFEFFSTPKSCHTLRWIFLQIFMKFDERNKKKLIPPFLFPWQLRQSLSTRFRFFFFYLSRFIRCGCCSYQVSSISVRRVTCYDHFCAFQFFSILAVFIVPEAILKIPKVVCTSTHSA